MRTRDPFNDTVSLRFARSASQLSSPGVSHLRSGTVLSSLAATARDQQDILDRRDTAAAPAGTTHTVGG